MELRVVAEGTSQPNTVPFILQTLAEANIYLYLCKVVKINPLLLPYDRNILMKGKFDESTLL